MSAPHNQPPAEDRLFTDESFAAELFWEKNRRIILVVAALVVVAAVGVIWWLIESRNRTLAAQAAFATATDLAGWQNTIREYPGTLPASDAMFLAAEALRNEGKLDESTALYREILSEFPAHPLAGGARLGLAANLSAAGKDDEALAALKAAEDGGGYVAPFAAILQGRELLRLGRLSEAKDVFTRVATTYSGSPLSRLAINQVEEIEPLISAPAN